MSKIAERTIPKYSLVRRLTQPWEENMIAGDTDAKGVKVYAFQASEAGRLVYKFFKRFDVSELKIVGCYQSAPDYLPKLVG